METPVVKNVTDLPPVPDYVYPAIFNTSAVTNDTRFRSTPVRDVDGKITVLYE